MIPKWMRQLLMNELVIVPQMEFEHIKEQVRSSRKLSLNVLNQCKKPKVENSLQLHVAPVEPENMWSLFCVNSKEDHVSSAAWTLEMQPNLPYTSTLDSDYHTFVCWVFSCLHLQGFFYVLLITTRYLTRPLLNILLGHYYLSLFNSNY